MTAFTNQVNNRPMPFALLKVIDRQLSDFVSQQTARHENCEQGAVALTSESAGIRCLSE